MDRHDSVLVVIDAQPAFIAQTSMNDHERAAASATLERLIWFAGLAADLDVPVVLVQDGAERNGDSDERLLGRLPKDTRLLEKDTFSAAEQPDVQRAIASTGRGTLVLAGFETDTCICQSATGLLSNGYRILALEDATYSTGDLEHTRGLSRMRQAGVEIHDCKGLTFEWLRAVSDALDALSAYSERFGPPPLRL